MPFKDLREFVQALQARGDINSISGASPDLEIGGVSQIAAESPQCPALLFDAIDGFAPGQRILTNLMASKVRERLIFGISEELSDRDALRSLKEKLAKYRPLAPVKASATPVRQNNLSGAEIDLAQLPWLRWYEGDRERRHHDAVVILRDPGWDRVEISLADLAPIDHETLAIHLQSTNGPPRQKYWPDGSTCPVAISLGHEPGLLGAALLGLPHGCVDFAFAGWLRGAPVEIIDSESSGLPLPATAEILLEGKLTGTSNTDATVKVRRVYMRDDPIIIGNAPFFGATHGVLASRAASLWSELERSGCANIVAINQRACGVTLLAIKQVAEGDVQRTAKALMESSAGRDLRYAVIVDHDIDPYNLEKVFWAIVTRYEAQQAVQIVQHLSSAADAKGDTGSGSAAIIDGCRPFRWIDKFPRTTDISEELMKKTVEKWGKVLERR